MTKEGLAVAATFLVAELRKEIEGSVNDCAESFFLWLLQEDAVKNMTDKGASSAKKSQSVTLFKIFRFHAILVGLVKIDNAQRLEQEARWRELASFYDDLELSDFWLS